MIGGKIGIVFCVLMMGVNGLMASNELDERGDFNIQGSLSEVQDSTDPAYVFVDGLDLTILGKGHDEEHYGRLPEKYKEIVRSPVWSLSRHSAGVKLMFRSNSPEIVARWEVMSYSDKTNMTQIGASGLDLYCRVNGRWQYVNSGVPTGHKNEKSLITDMDTTYKEFMLHLPLYDGLRSIEIGVMRGYEIESSQQMSEFPIVVYGTSITQGASASRPGMAYPSIISRNMDVEFINLGFSGNGRFESSVGQFLCEIESQLLVLDCTPNSSPDVIRANALNLIKQFRSCQPSTPILMVESIVREYSHFRTQNPQKFGTKAYLQTQNRALATAFEAAKAAGISEIYYLESDGLIGDDHEGTVDGTHLTDLGMMRIAHAIQQKIEAILFD